MNVTIDAIGAEDVEAYWSAVGAGDERAARAVVADVRRRGASPTDVFDGLVIPAQQRVGQRWAANDWTVAHEHAATAISEAVVLRLAADIPDPDRAGRPLLVACVEREWHALPALVVAHTLRAGGHAVDYLGANVSPETVVGRIIDAGPRAVLVSASLSSSLPRVRRLVEAVTGTGTPVVVGGHAFDAAGVRAARLGATAYAGDVATLDSLLLDLPGHVAPAAPLRHPGAVEALEILAEVDEIGRDVIRGSEVDLGEAGVPDAMAPDDWRVVLSTYVPHVIGCVAGGLLTEDPSVPGQARTWLTDVLALRGGDPRAVDALWQALATRLREYPEAVRLIDLA
ncbi:twin-arginine translocation pathway signal protein [Nocardioides guangzhouensis]|uniref:Twin-arginine translocation pathway signal protein n=1 Tax=Nocardioides guangzhouensis TaxID=2497878 RepID=A0A4Q4ZKR4_9ACTN|nr:cobalamin-dependent protein [Nocardioides guangzhouensis]RYP88943.1 twin-arginine translocation pathway signal protein [Nocardioides guangzhouensis]